MAHAKYFDAKYFVLTIVKVHKSISEFNDT